MPMRRAVLSLFLLIVASFGSENVSSRVNTPYGPVEGFEFESANVFLGIPFAQRPVGDDRLEKPKKPSKWTKTLEAKNFSSTCIPVVDDPKNANSSEDCLYLNIMAPKNTTSQSRSPVFVFIHGGGFQTGSASHYGYKEIVRNFVSKGLVFVTVNYRLGPYGFLTTEDSAMRGNLGLWDQKAALEFIKKVILSFGGNPKEITVAGESAGAASVSALTLSPLTNRLFQRAVQMSGSTFAQWAIDPHVANVSNNFFEAIGCRGASKVIKKCLKARSVDDFKAAADETLGKDGRLVTLCFNPRIDGELFPANLTELIKKAPKISSIIGVTDAETAPFLLDNSGAKFIKIPESKWATFDEQDLKETFALLVKGVDDLANLMNAFFISNSTLGGKRNSSFYLNQLVNATTELYFALPSYQEAVEKMDNGWPVYLYYETYYDKKLHGKVPYIGSFHANELFYLFFPQEETSDEGKNFQKAFVNALVSFANTGSPMVEDIKWDAIRPENKIYMELSRDSGMKERFSEESMVFWTKTVPNQVDINQLKTLLPGTTY